MLNGRRSTALRRHPSDTLRFKVKTKFGRVRLANAPTSGESASKIFCATLISSEPIHSGAALGTGSSEPRTWRFRADTHGQTWRHRQRRINAGLLRLRSQRTIFSDEILQ